MEKNKIRTDDEEIELRPSAKKQKTKRAFNKTDEISNERVCDKPFIMHCSGFSPQTKHSDLEKFFGAENIDRDRYIRLKFNEKTKKPYAFVAFKNRKIAMDIKETLSTKSLDGHKLELKHRFFKK